MAAILLDIKAGDEVIMPSFTFVSTANAFVLRGANVRFVDSRSDHPGMDESQVEGLITERTKAIVVVHYAGVACDMDAILALADRYGLCVVEDAAQAIDSFYKGRPLGSIGHLAAFSFHETKNIHSGEGGMLVVNDAIFSERAEIIWEKGTNRAAFSRREVDHYNWLDLGSSFLPSEITAAFLYAQLELLDRIQQRRMDIWQAYDDLLTSKVIEAKDYLGKIVTALSGLKAQPPHIPPYASNNAHLYYLVCEIPAERETFINRLKDAGIMAIPHYQPLHLSPFYRDKHDGRVLPRAVKYAECLVRLPLYYRLPIGEGNGRYSSELA
jgi:dTDP-4-amino-4,6-dideoxygalactose transaminase